MSELNDNGSQDLFNYWAAGMNTLTWTQEQMENFFSRMIDQNRISREDGKRIAAEFFEQVKNNQLHLQNMINENIKEYIAALKLPTQTMIDEMKKNIDELSKKMADIKKAE